MSVFLVHPLMAVICWLHVCCLLFLFQLRERLSVAGASPAIALGPLFPKVRQLIGRYCRRYLIFFLTIGRGTNGSDYWRPSRAAGGDGLVCEDEIAWGPCTECARP